MLTERRRGRLQSRHAAHDGVAVGGGLALDESRGTRRGAHWTIRAVISVPSHSTRAASQPSKGCGTYAIDAEVLSLELGQVGIKSVLLKVVE
jgi:hypothetical protein